MVLGVQVGDYWRACPQAFRIEATGSGPLALPAKSRGGRARGRGRSLGGVPPPVQLKSGRGRTPRRRSRAPGDSSLCTGRGGAPVAQRLGFARRPRPALDPDLPRSGPWSSPHCQWQSGSHRGVRGVRAAPDLSGGGDGAPGGPRFAELRDRVPCPSRICRNEPGTTTTGRDKSTRK